MISGSKIRIDRWGKAMLAALTLALATSSAWAFDLPELMSLLAQRRSGEATFTEQRFVRGLEGPLDASGVLSFTAPDRLMRRTITPRPEMMSVEGNILTLSRSGRTRTVALDSMPELLGMVEAMRGTLSGNAQSLQRYFRSTLTGTSNDWALELKPIDERLAAQVRSMRLTGRGGEVLGVEMEFIGGDRSVMNITPDRRPAGAAAAPARSTP
ncbi:LolA-related protein [Variovorax sp. Sphag1AA]|uniref:LolA-related protein n=1 Tax=Variovorax sp. Sphag1AA TaxID=2587027 RepID=UPI001613B237|nr:LolA-related protein [Variovorax sp. Sphag1AA]MBB3176224.1 outer membrane lipoprotein-sorting protein [Variovorax sp. Sphag1AA]